MWGETSTELFLVARIVAHWISRYNQTEVRVSDSPEDRWVLLRLGQLLLAIKGTLGVSTAEI
jgi:hypothetical protein